MSPEVLKGAYSYEADAWSVGTICYILLSGTRGSSLARRRCSGACPRLAAQGCRLLTPPPLLLLLLSPLAAGFPPFWGSSDQIIFHRILTQEVVSTARCALLRPLRPAAPPPQPRLQMQSSNPASVCGSSIRPSIHSPHPLPVCPSTGL